MTDERLWTWEDIMHLPEREQPEILYGRPYWASSPKFHHARIVARIANALVGADDDDLPEGWWIGCDTGIRLSRHQIVAPDLCGWRRSRVPVMPDTWPCDIRPDWVCEVLSASTRARDRGLKAQVYAEAGVPWLWLVDPEDRTVEVLELQVLPEGSLETPRWLRIGCFSGSEPVGLAPFLAFPVVVDGLFLPVVGEAEREAEAGPVP